MAIIVATQTTQLNVVANQDYLLPEGNILSSTNDGINFGAFSGINFYVYGTVFAASDGTEDDFTGAATNIAIVVGRTGSVIGASDGIEFNAINVTVLNNGEVIGSSDNGIELFGVNAVVNNNGIVDGASAGVSLAGLDGALSNTGMITGTHGVEVEETSNRIINSGSIIGAGDQIPTFNGSDYDLAIGIYFSGSTDAIVQNSGLISGQDYAIYTDGDNENFTIKNSGEILGDIVGDNAAQTIFNSGVITGDIDLAEGADRYIASGSGLTSGLVSGGNGNDTLVGADGGDDFSGGAGLDVLSGHDGDDTLSGGADDDTLVGGAGNDSLGGGGENDLLVGNDGDDYADGGAGADTINGGAGEDELYGGTENDTIVGGDGDDFLDGGSGLDVLDGGAGVDTLIGGLGNDLMRGRDGVDFLNGGQGLDVLTGGEGADVFVYEALSDSTANANRDVILDFELGVDQINLVQVIPGVFAFRGTAGFTSTGVAELRLQETASGSTIVRIDADGNGTSDMEINVAGVQGLTVDDFVL